MWRKGRAGALSASCGIAGLLIVLGTSTIARQDLAGLMTRQSDLIDRARQHLLASPLATIHAALFGPRRSFLKSPARGGENVLLAKFDPNASADDLIGEGPPGPTVNRAAKGDLLVPMLQIEINREIVASLRGQPPVGAPTGDEDLEAAVRFVPFPEYDISLSLELNPEIPPAPNAEAGEDDADGEEPRTAFGELRLYFEGVPMTAVPMKIEPWPPGQAPMLETAPVTAQSGGEEGPAAEPRPAPKREPVTVAAKGEAHGEPEGLLTPAMRLSLSPKARAKAERCLANAVYFESRGESVRGQIAVAQVVLNRVFSGYYPEDVCGVVYQGARRHLSCQFTFACDGIPDVVTEPDAWERATRIAKAALDGKIWLKDVGKATHYHAYWVNPYWVRSMRRLQRIGVHSFYRPRRWGDGSDAPVWGRPANPELAAKF